MDFGRFVLQAWEWPIGFFARRLCSCSNYTLSMANVQVGRGILLSL